MKMTNRQILNDVTALIGKPVRYFPRNAKGHPKGDGAEIVYKTSKGTSTKKVFVHKLKDGRTVRYTVEIA